MQNERSFHWSAPDTGRNDFSTIDRFGVGELVVALGKLLPYAELEATIVGEVEDVFANHADLQSRRGVGFCQFPHLFIETKDSQPNYVGNPCRAPRGGAGPRCSVRAKLWFQVIISVIDS